MEAQLTNTREGDYQCVSYQSQVTNASDWTASVATPFIVITSVDANLCKTHGDMISVCGYANVFVPLGASITT